MGISVWHSTSQYVIPVQSDIDITLYVQQLLDGMGYTVRHSLYYSTYILQCTKQWCSSVPVDVLVSVCVLSLEPLRFPPNPY